ncbi:MAG: type VII secretion protein EccCb [Nocardioides sp.]
MTQATDQTTGEGVLLLRPPPDLPEPDAGGAATAALPMLGSVGSMAVMISMTSTAMGPSGHARALLTAAVFVAITLATLAIQLDRAARQRRGKIDSARMTYFGYLTEVRTTIREHARRQRRRPLDPLSLCVGATTAPLDLELVCAPDGVRTDPACAEAAARLVAAQRRQPGMPLTVALDQEPWLSITGDPDQAKGLARALICAATRDATPVIVVIATTASRLAEWDWTKWIPQVSITTLPPPTAPSLPEWVQARAAHSALPPESRHRHVLLIIDELPFPQPTRVPNGMTIVDLPATPAGQTLCLGTSPPDRSREDRDNPVDSVRWHTLSIVEAEAIARRCRATAETPNVPGGDAHVPDLMTLLDLARSPVGLPHFDHQRPAAQTLRVPLGITAGGEPLTLDLKESAAGGVGPHGLVVGATGSGKSELLRTLVVGLALTHDPGHLNLVLIDFKGGATFAGLAGLPHVAALVTNLANETTLVDRMQDALEGELIRRQEVLRRAGSFASVGDYHAALAVRQQPGAAAEASDVSNRLPALLIVIDEFAELLVAKPEFLEVFLTVGRLGRSLGVHLLLASQRLEEGRLRGLEAHLSYRIGLRTFSESESRAVLGTTDAAHLPSVPGSGYLRTGAAGLQRFTAAYVSGPMPPPAQPAEPRRVVSPFVVAVDPFDASSRDLRAGPAPSRQPGLDAPAASLLDVAVAQLAGQGPPAHRVWVPPLGPPVRLGTVLGDLAIDPELGLIAPTWRQRPGLLVPLGVVDRPREQRHDVLTANLAGAGGHLIAVGAPRSGKTTMLATFLVALCLTRTPREARIFIIATSTELLDLSDLPQVSGIAGPGQTDLVRRIVAEVGRLIATREKGTPERQDDPTEAEPVFVVIDGWDRIVSANPDLATDLHEIGIRGLAVNVHLVVATSRWADLRTGTRELFGTRVELRLGDPIDSEIDRRAAGSVPRDQPGRGIVVGPKQVLLALPELDRTVGIRDGGLAAMAGAIADAWPGAPVPGLRLLPDRVKLCDLPADDQVRLGVRETDLGTITLDWAADAHLLAFGDAGSGKSNLLRVLGREIIRVRRPDRAQLVVIDVRRSLMGEFGDDHLLHYATTAEQAAIVVGELAGQLRRRLPGPEVDVEQLRARSWWTGPEVFVLVDDYDLVSGGGPSPLTALMPLLAQADDVGLHLLLARRSGGASRALFEPAILALRDLRTTGVLLSGRPEEGPLFGGVRPEPAPPGRARLVARDRCAEISQLAWTDPQP